MPRWKQCFLICYSATAFVVANHYCTKANTVLPGQNLHPLK